jgi:hypothetical protein
MNAGVGRRRNFNLFEIAHNAMIQFLFYIESYIFEQDS